MEPRGMKGFAVVAMKPAWKKPRFCHDHGTTRLLTFSKKEQADIEARRMTLERCVFGNDEIEVDWIVVPVWTETMQ